MSRELSTQLLGGFLSFSLHVAAGFALLWTWSQGAPARDRSGSDSGTALAVDLVSLDSDGRLSESNAGANTHAIDSRPERAPPVRPSTDGRAEPAPPANGPQSAADSASPAAQGDARELADLPSAEAFAYRQRLEGHLARYRIYPSAARAAGREGVVMLHFVMTDDGKVLEAWVGESSGVSDIDREAVAAVLRAQPLPAFPQGWPGRLDIILPVKFRLG
jgi:protein TonB